MRLEEIEKWLDAQGHTKKKVTKPIVEDGPREKTALEKRQEEAGRQWKAYRDGRNWRWEQTEREFPNFGGWRRTLVAQRKETRLVGLGQTDLDLAGLVRDLGLHLLPKSVREDCLMVGELFLRFVTKRQTGLDFSDPLPQMMTPRGSNDFMEGSDLQLLRKALSL